MKIVHFSEKLYDFKVTSQKRSFSWNREKHTKLINHKFCEIPNSLNVDDLFTIKYILYTYIRSPVVSNFGQVSVHITHIYYIFSVPKNRKIDFFYKICLICAHNKIGRFIFLKTEAPSNLKHFWYAWYESRPLFWKVIQLQSNITRKFVCVKLWETYKIDKSQILWNFQLFRLGWST